MLCRLVNPVTDVAWTGDAAAPFVEWAATASGDAGAARLHFPPGHPATTAGVLLPRGGSPCFLDAGEAGRFAGLTGQPTWGEDGLTVPVLEMAARLNAYTVPVNLTVTARPAGMIARLAVQLGMGALGFAPPRIGAIVDAPPVISDYAFAGQTVGQVLADMAARSGCEPRLRDGVFDWLPPDIGAAYPHLLVDGADLAGLTERTADDAVTAVVAAGPLGHRVRAELPDALGGRWREVTIRVNTTSVLRLRREALAHLYAHLEPSRTIEARLRRTPHDDPASARTHWANIREGDLVPILRPYGDAGASVAARARVLRRRYEEGPGTMTLSLFEVRPATTGVRAVVSYAELGETFSPTAGAYTDLASQLAGLQRSAGLTGILAARAGL